MEADNSQPQLKPRTKQFAIRTIRLVEALPATRTADVIGRQLLRSALSAGSNYRSACRARSRADFVSKMGIVEEEIDECLYWMEMLIESSAMKQERLEPLMSEAGEIAAMVVASIKTARRNRR